jgi:Ser/Thr protein kinase RdoA (MazF antagonist)
LDLDRAPTPDERVEILRQAALVSKIEYKPPYIYDTWAVSNIHDMFESVQSYIASEDLPLVEEVIKRYDRIPLQKLPQTFVHGDFTKANVMKGEDGNIYILDFSVSNWYPRIQELAVITANLLHDTTTTLRDRVETVIKKYAQFVVLTDAEKQYLYDYALAGVAMEFMGAYQEKYIHGNDTEETDYWLRLGRDGLRSELL